ncbi:hypothetical protein SLS58_009003 [Diplodia intermedia]|uniref:Uncharacterized protein n=1 Tax=Diplodia intermedia TaxID=856260 RepID=A0ABR3TF86_9PEZI
MALSNAPTVLEENSDPKAFTSDVFKREKDDFPVLPILTDSPHGAWSSGISQWDHGLHQYVPFDDEWDDKMFLIHLVSFYNVARFTGKPFESMGLRVIRRIDIARLQDGPVVGKRECVLDLGTSGREGRPIHWLTHLLKMPDNQHHYIVDQLKENNVVCKEDTKDRKCLDVIRTYKTSYVSLAVCIPTILSLIIGIVWTSVAATVYSQEVQVSAQTAFTISSYIVTAGTEETS